ncbi:hypothetical protein Ana3638_03560 [Anaerocolumna sedimenticola]|uniref:Uncharacterized protein n=1 Tax=Anaerocolumna sedimenticola TaxID=2696063 RepID=A0A6P1TFK6_9FIRM|nr:hypothetical protein [Anaerocolumna sedimenticola]QHQ59970.1 hypothetical protein Ana3638_03560 [Anaerocolumna sedimenticola]
MNIIGDLLFAIGRPSYLLGARPDAAIIFLLFFVIALLICIKIANRNHLFSTSDKRVLNNAKECETSK